MWTELFTATWRRHRSKIAYVLSRIASRFDLITNRASSSQLDSFHNDALLQEQQNLAVIQREDLARRQAVHAWLKPTDMENEQEHLKRIRTAHPGTCRWLLRDETFAEWFEAQSVATSMARFTWLHGKPGSGKFMSYKDLTRRKYDDLYADVGKTVLASLVVEEARRSTPSPTVLFFYFKHDDYDRNNFLSMARTLLMQILDQHPHTLDYFYGKCCDAGGNVLISRGLMEELLAFALKNCENVYIVLDGLDECCSRDERREIVTWFRDTIGDFPPDARKNIRCLFISQHDSARKDFRDLPSIAVDSHNNEEDIEAFCESRSMDLVEKLGITEQRAKEIATFVSASAGGTLMANKE